MGMIRAVVFDFGQTLVDSSEGFRTAEREAQMKAFKSLGLADFEGFLAVYRQIRSELHGRSLFSRKEILTEVFRRFGREADPLLLEEWEDSYWKRVQEMTRLFPEAMEVLAKLRERAFRLALITNAQGQKEEGRHRLANFPDLERLFEAVVIAGEGGLPPKPDPAPFRLCLNMLGLVPEQAVYVGDDWRIDVEGAKSVGMRPVWLKHRLVRRNWPEVEPDVPVIESLSALLDMDSLLWTRD